MLRNLVILDFEATCDDGATPDPQEVIEFPSVLLSLETLATRDEFVSFVRPVHHPELTTFCREFTGIRQEDVDAAEPFPQVLAKHTDWLRGLEDWAFALCGDWDLGTMFPAQCRTSGLDYIPLPYRQWVNLKHTFAGAFGLKKGPGMAGMLQTLGLELQGHHHRGIDDCRNIARIACELVRRGALPEITTRLAASRFPPIELRLTRGEESHTVTLTKRTLGSLLGLASAAFGTVVRLELTEAELAELRSGTVLRVT